MSFSLFGNCHCMLSVRLKFEQLHFELLLPTILKMRNLKQIATATYTTAAGSKRAKT